MQCRDISSMRHNTKGSRRDFFQHLLEILPMIGGQARPEPTQSSVQRRHLHFQAMHSYAASRSTFPNHSLLSSIDSHMSHAPPLFSSATGLIGHRIRSTTAWIHRHSVLSSSALPPPLLVYQQLIATSRPYLHCATGVEPA